MADALQEEKALWRPVTVEQQFVVKGGMCNKPHVLQTMEITVSGGSKHFCRVVKSELWLLKCGVGVGAKNGAMKRSKVIDELKQKLHELSKGVYGAAAVADQHESQHEEDPMLALDDIGTLGEPSPKKGKYQPKRACNQIFEIEMPCKPAVARNAAVAGMRKISVLGRSTNQLWIAVEDVGWLINYVAMEVALGGVDERPEPAVAEGNCDVPDLRMRWDFGMNVWRAVFVAGKLKGAAVNSSVANMNVGKWESVKAAVAVSVKAAVAVEFGSATFQELKEGTRLFLLAKCTDILSKNA